MNCRKCGTELPAGAMFCAECGTTVIAPKLVEPQTRTRPGDTAIIQPLDLNASAPAFLEPRFEQPVKSAAKPAPVVPAPVVSVPIVPVPVVSAPVAPVPTAVPSASNVETTPALRAEPVTPPVVAPAVIEPPAAPPTATPPTAAPPISTFESQHNDLEATRIVRSRQGDRFVLQFSTGENSTVFGTGLIGRNPVTQPGEFVDQLVTIFDSGKSVSKTHLEFGQAAGVFWIIDRFSANGTIVRQPDARPQRLDPGKRQTVARGTRVDIGEQFFVVS